MQLIVVIMLKSHTAYALSSNQLLVIKVKKMINVPVCYLEILPTIVTLLWKHYFLFHLSLWYIDIKNWCNTRWLQYFKTLKVKKYSMTNTPFEI